jgi:hypothetical protein
MFGVSEVEIAVFFFPGWFLQVQTPKTVGTTILRISENILDLRPALAYISMHVLEESKDKERRTHLHLPPHPAKLSASRQGPSESAGKSG